MEKRLNTYLIAHGKYQKAEEGIKRVLETPEKAFGPHHSNTLKHPRNQTGVLHRLREYSAAEKVAQRVVEGEEKVSGPEHSTTLRSMGENQY